MEVDSDFGIAVAAVADGGSSSTDLVLVRVAAVMVGPKTTRPVPAVVRLLIAILCDRSIRADPSLRVLHRRSDRAAL